MTQRYWPPGIEGPQVDTADPQGGIGMPVQRLYRRPLWDSPAVQGPPHNLPAPGDRLSPPQTNLIGSRGAGMNPQPAVNPILLPGTQLVRDKHNYANIIEAPFDIPTNQSFQVLPQAIGLRNMLIMRNSSPGAQVVFVSFGTQASIVSVLRLTAGQTVMFDTVVQQNDVNAIADVAGAILTVAYSQYAPT